MCLYYIMSFLKATHYLRNVQKILDAVGDAEVLSVTVARAPLSRVTTFLLNIVSLGEFDKRLAETPHDTLFHLSLVLTTSKGKYVLEKNDVISMKRFTKLKPRSETMEVAVPAGLAVRAMLDKTRAAMGDKFFSYKALDNNCQFFVSSLLEANQMSNAALDAFVMQDTRHLFENNPQFRKIVNSITDAGAVTNRAVQKAEEVATQPVGDTIADNVVRPIHSELLQPLFRSLTLDNMMKRAAALNPFQRPIMSPPIA